MIRVPGKGQPNARILIVGEAPGAEEEARLEPFVGAAGHMLTSMLHDAGINRSETYITNVCKHRPPGNEMSAWIKPILKSKKSSPPPGFIEFRNRWVESFIPAQVAELEQEILAVRPNVIVAVGNTPLWALAGQDSITNWRGSKLQVHIQGQPFKLVPTYHPASILRVYENRWDTVQDLRRAKIEAASQTFTQPNYTFTVRPSYVQTIEFLRWLQSKVESGPFKLTSDIETRKKQITCMGIGWSKTDAFCIPFMDSKAPNGCYFSLEEELEIVRRITELFNHPNTQLVNQNIQYDAFYWMRLWHLFARPAGDTMIQQHVLFPGKEKDLAYIASMHCEHYRYWKEDHREWNIRTTAEEALWHYNCLDCVYTYEATESLDKALDTAKLRPQYDFQMSLFEPVMRMMFRGVRILPERRQDFSDTILKAIQHRERTLETIFGHPVNPRSPKKLVDLFYKDLNCKPQINRKTGKVSTDDKSMEAIGKANPLLLQPIKWIQQCKSLGVYRSNFLEAKGPRNRLFTSFGLGGAHTFRFNSSTNPMYEGTNLQNVPRPEEAKECPYCDSKHIRQFDFHAECADCQGVWDVKPDVRGLFAPDDGYVLVDNDLARADLQVVVWEAGDEDLKQKIRESADLHTENGKDAGISRQIAKTFIHGTNYGGSARTMAINCKMTVHAAEQAQTRWFAAHPGIKNWHLEVLNQLQTTRSVTNKFGYRRFFFERLDGLLPEALAWVPQSTVACVINRALKLLSVYEPELELLLQIHDSLLSQVRKDLLPLYRTRIKQAFDSIVVPYDDPLVIPCGFKTGPEGEPWGELREN